MGLIPPAPHRSKSEGANRDKGLEDGGKEDAKPADGEPTPSSSTSVADAAPSTASQTASPPSTVPPLPAPAANPVFEALRSLPPGPAAPAAAAPHPAPNPLSRVNSAPSRINTTRATPSRTPSNPTGAGGILTPGLQVRASLLSRIYRGIGEMGGNRRFSLFLTAVLTVAQLVAFVTILALSAGQACDQPLQAYIIVHTIRVTLSWPASFYTALAPRRPSRNDTNPTETIRLREARRALGTPAWDSRIRLFQDGMTLLAFTWFILGNYFFFSSHTCRATSPQLYWTSLVVLIFGWLYALEIIFIILAVTFFLPIVILGIRVFGWGAKKQEIGPITKEQIEKIPLVLYIPSGEDESPAEGEAAPTIEADGAEGIEMADVSKPKDLEEGAGKEGESSDAAPAEAVPSSSTAAAANATPSPNPSATPTERQRGRRRRKLARLFFHVKRRRRNAADGDASFSTSDAAYIPTPYPLHPLPANQSTCPICLCDFEPPPLKDSGVDPSTHAWEPLRRLPACGHCFHRDCLDEWLGTSGRCPLCQVPVVAKKEGRKRRRTVTGGTGGTEDEAAGGA